MKLYGTRKLHREAMQSRTFLPAWIALAAFLLAFAFAEQQNRTIHKQATRAEVQNAAGILRSQLEGIVNADIQLVRGLIAAIATNVDISQQEFNELANRAVGDRRHIKNIAVAPDLVVRMVHPFEPNKAVLGLDYNVNASQRAAALRVRDSGEMVLAGPVNLVQGGTGFVGRFPIFVDNGGVEDFWGIVSVVIDESAVYAKAGFTDPSHGLKLALRGRDGTGAAGGVFHGEETVFSDMPILLDISLPEGSWQMAAIPAGGWNGVPDNAWTLRAILIGVGFLVIAPTFLVCLISSHRNSVIEFLTWQEAELKENRETLQRLSMVAQNASDSIVVSQADGRISWVNRAFSETTGYSAAEAIGKTPAELLNGPATDPDKIALIQDHVTKGKRLRTEILNYTKSGDKIWVETHLVPVLDEMGDVSFTIGVERDITAAKAHEMELARAKKAAENADRAKSEFLANMSHEIRTPMNGIMGMAEILAERPMAQDSKDLVRVIRDSAQGLLQIINDVLDLSRLEAGKLEISEQDFDLHRCVLDSVDLIRSAAQDKGLRLSVQLADDLPVTVRGDDGRLRQVLLNLLGNAVKFTSDGGVTLHVRQADAVPGKLIFTVEDTGMGLTEEQKSRIFERFSQADAAITRKYGGTGLGLTISRHLAEQMGGAISVESENGKGSRFTVEIQTQPPRGDALAIHPKEAVDMALLRGSRVLLAEDNKTNRMLVHKFLAGTGVELWNAEDGEEAVEICQRLRPDLVLMDMSMPKLDGLAATRKIRTLNIPQPGIVALTANAFESDRNACLSAGMDDFLSKPLRKKTLIETMTAQLARQARNADRDAS
ncbi:response regulator [Mameliella alba]|nr:response regulator [Mameliella alba]